jgi:hypothetical protein
MARTPTKTEKQSKIIFAKATKIAVAWAKASQYWVRPHLGLGKNKTPVMAIGLYHRPISMLELLSLRGFSFLTP